MTASILDIPGGRERVLALLERSTDRSGSCWEWTGSRIGKGYGNFRMKGQNFLIHRSSYEIHHGRVPAGLFVLHSCDNPPCANPEHLRAGSHGDNMRDRSERDPHASSAKTHCPQGHPYDEANTYRFPDDRRACRTCTRVHVDALPSSARTHCPQGHPYDEANTYRPPRGDRMCRTCRRDAARRWRASRNGSAT
ncbi:HNH endonuclease signature motif containing protein [Streptomyces sp. NPDC058891]|uniref:HNH endonuclease signature motif containing protein n=1 Tax=Streptomyces sp. NPDC058891 TaxID=3346667 RepID=UPI0036B1AE21